MRVFPSLSREYEPPLWEKTPLATLICVPLALVIAIAWFITRGSSLSFLLHNLLSASIALRTVHFIRLGTLKVSAVLLAVTAAYDVLWIASSPVVLSQVSP